MKETRDRPTNTYALQSGSNNYKSPQQPSSTTTPPNTALSLQSSNKRDTTFSYEELGISKEEFEEQLRSFRDKID